jgi:catechol 2,3-dioxygenase-like lactoylglutathione lyase family enzyme
MALKLQETTYVVEDLDRALPTYTGTLGFEVQHREDWGLAVLRKDGMLLVLRTAASFAREFPEHAEDVRPRVNLQSSDLEADAARLRAAGLRVSHIHGEPGGARAMLFWDRDDNPFFVWSIPGVPF